MVEVIHEPGLPQGDPYPYHVCPICHTAIQRCGETTVYVQGDPPRCLQCIQRVACPVHGVSALHVEPDDPTKEAICKHCHDAITPRHLYRSPRAPVAVLEGVMWLLGIGVVGIAVVAWLCGPGLEK